MLLSKAEESWRPRAPSVVCETSRVADLHTVTYSRRNQDKKAAPVVCLHGFGSANGIFSTSLPLVANRFGGACHALDMPGCGLSEREASWSRLSRFEAEELVTSRLESWQTQMGYEKIHLVAHSVGACLATAYAERRPESVESLILVSPAGVPGRSKSDDVTLLSFLWKFSPFDFARNFPQYSKRIADAYVERRFRDNPGGIKPVLGEYIFRNMECEPKSLGGILHNIFLQPPGRGPPQYGVDPLEPRLATGVASLKGFIYGTRDWISDDAAFRIVHRRKTDPSSVLFVAGAGHNLMVDNPMGFADALLTLLGDPPANQPTQMLRTEIPENRHLTCPQKILTVFGSSYIKWAM